MTNIDQVYRVVDYVKRTNGLILEELGTLQKRVVHPNDVVSYHVEEVADNLDVYYDQRAIVLSVQSATEMPWLRTCAQQTFIVGTKDQRRAAEKQWSAPPHPFQIPPIWTDLVFSLMSSDKKTD